MITYCVHQPDFQPLGAKDDGYNESLVIHAHPESAGKQLVLLVHGLNGTRYGTWGKLPQFLFEDCSPYDIGLYEYSSGTRRLRGLSTKLERHAELLADLIRDLDYEQVVLVGHSMGGLLCQGTIRSLIDSKTSGLNGELALQRVIGLFLMATPQAGSLRVRKIFLPFSQDARLLAPHSPFVTGLQRRFADVVQTNGAEPTSPHKVYIPTFALVATNDRWVDDLSSRLSLPRDHIKTVRASHTSLVKPRARFDDGYHWFLPRLQSLIAGSTKREVGSGMAAPEVVPKLSLEVSSDAAVNFLTDYAKMVSQGLFDHQSFETQIRIIPNSDRKEGERS